MFFAGLLTDVASGFGLLDCASAAPVIPNSAAATLIAAMAKKRRRSYLISSDIYLSPIESLRVDSPQLAASDISLSHRPSFPHVFSGNLGESGTGPPIKAFGGDEIRNRSHAGLSIPRSLLRGSSFHRS